MREVEGVADLSGDQQIDIPQVRIRADRPKMSLYGLTMADIDGMVDIAFLGMTVSEVYDGQNSHDLVVRYDEPFRKDLESIRTSLVDTPTGARVPLDMVTDIRVDRGPNYISRENVQRKIVVSANVGDGTSGRSSRTSARRSPPRSTSRRATSSRSAASSRASARRRGSSACSASSRSSLIVVALYAEFGNLRDTRRSCWSTSRWRLSAG